MQIEQTLTLSQRYELRKARRIQRRRNRKDNLAHRLAASRRAELASTATIHFQNSHTDLLTDAVIRKF